MSELRDRFIEAHKDAIVDDRVYKGFRGAPSFNKAARTARFTMSAEVEDRDGDIIVVAGIDTANFEKLPTGLVFHASRNWPIGRWSDIEKIVTGRPKRLEGTINLLPEGKEEAADKVATHLEYGTMGACSIGFLPDYDQMEMRQEVREDGSKRFKGFLMKSIELLECSIVPIPSNPAALAKAAKEGSILARDLIEEVLDTYAKDPKTGMLVPKAEFEAAYKQATGERTFTLAGPLDGETLENLRKRLKEVPAGEPIQILQETPPAVTEPKGILAGVEALFAKYFPNTEAQAAVEREAQTEAAALQAEEEIELSVRREAAKVKAAAAQERAAKLVAA